MMRRGKIEKINLIFLTFYSILWVVFSLYCAGMPVFVAKCAGGGSTKIKGWEYYHGADQRSAQRFRGIRRAAQEFLPPGQGAEGEGKIYQDFRRIAKGKPPA